MLTAIFMHPKMSSKWSESQETTSNLDKTSYRDSRLAEMSDLDDLYQKSKMQVMQNEAQEEQRVFYSKCLAIKMKMKSKELSQHIPVALIYRDAVQNGVSQAEWDGFIEQAFQYPEKYVDISKLKHKKKHGLKNKLTEIASNKQFNSKKKFDILSPIEVIYE